MKKVWIYVFVMMLLLTSSIAAGEKYSLDQAVPFGIVDASSGNTAAVYKKASTKNKIATVDNGTICQIENTERIGGKTWYKIKYYDKNAHEISGYIAGGNFRQMSIGELIAAMADSKTAKYMQYFVGLSITASSSSNTTTVSGTSFGDTVGASVMTTPAPTATKKPTATPQPVRSYILNKNTKVFHKPGCSSRSAAKEKLQV